MTLADMLKNGPPGQHQVPPGSGLTHPAQQPSMGQGQPAAQPVAVGAAMQQDQAMATISQQTAQTKAESSAGQVKFEPIVIIFNESKLAWI